VALVLAGCAEEPRRGRVIVIGMDGATYRVLGPLLEQGQMPTLARLAKEGVSGPLQSFVPLLSPRVWTTVATGKSPLLHGVGNWVKAPDADGKSDLFYSYDKKARSLWNIASDRGMKVAVINWLITYPPEIVNGVMVSDHTLASDVEAQKYVGQIFAEGAGWKFDAESVGKQTASPVYPEEWLPKVQSLIANAPALTDFPNPFEGDRPLPKTANRKELLSYFTRDQALTHVALEIEREIRPDFAMILLQGVDRTSHYLFGCQYDPKSYPQTFDATPEEIAYCRESLLTYYRYTDALIGKLIASYGPDDLVIVLSDHGFEAGFRGNLTGDHTYESAAHGIFFARGPGIPAGQPAGDLTINDIAPTILSWLRLPVARDMDGKPAAFLPPSRVRAIDTYETGEPVKRLEGARSGEEGRVVEQLKQLGYVD
jgi:predicted AlkP superfamily phosphohydrolase/phosphomutase